LGSRGSPIYNSDARSSRGERAFFACPQTPVSLPLPKFCLGMDSLLRRLKDAATMPHLHVPYL
jgi:hypothetical protein